MLMHNALYFGDNLTWLRKHDFFPNGCVDLIYLDPPFNSNADYNVLFKEKNGGQSQAQLQAFDDTWQWDSDASALSQHELAQDRPDIAQFIELLSGREDKQSTSMAAYLSMMAVRLIELHRVLKETGTIYLHCDPTASHYLKTLMDFVFGMRNFRSEIIWRRSKAHSKLTGQYGPIHDVILFYSKSETYYFSPGARPYMKGYIEERFKFSDPRGRYQLNYLTGSGVRRGESGLPWQGFDPTAAGRHWAIPASLRAYLPENYQRLTIEKQLNHLLDLDLIHLPQKSGGQPMYKQYVGKGTPYQDIWAYQPHTQGQLVDTDEGIDEDVKALDQESEKLGYPTQKPVGLLKRIILTSCPKDGVVLDPFCGCGTTIVAAQEMGHTWLGIDITHLATYLIEQRLSDTFGTKIKETYAIYGDPPDVESAQALWNRNPKEFELWALSLVPAKPRPRDGGVDGITGFEDEGKTKKVVVQVKGGETLSPSIVRDLMGTVDKEHAAIGLLITLHDPTSGMVEMAVHGKRYDSPLWQKSFQQIQIRTIRELLVEKRPFDLPPQTGLFRRAPKTRARETNGQLL